MVSVKTFPKTKKPVIERAAALMPREYREALPALFWREERSFMEERAADNGPGLSAVAAEDARSPVHQDTGIE